jgi:hypothetical protein
MPVPMSVMQAAAQGDKKAMRLVEQEYGVGDGRRYAENWLTEEEPPPTVPDNVIGIEHPTRAPEQYNFRWGPQYRWDAANRVREGEIDILVDKIKQPEQYSFREPEDMLFSEKQIDPETHFFDRYAAYGKMQPGYVGLKTPGKPNKREAWEIEFAEESIPPPHIEKQVLELGLRGTSNDYWSATWGMYKLIDEGLLNRRQMDKIQEKLDKQYYEQERNKQRSKNIQSKRK